MEQFGDPRTNSKQLAMKPLGEVCIVERGGSPRPIANYITNSTDGINWIKIGDADGTRYISKTAEKIIPEGVRKSRMVQAGDLILSNSMSFGHPYILKIDGCIHDGWLVLHFDKTVFNALYLQTYLGLPVVYAIFETMAAGGVVNNLNSEIVKKLPVIVPAIDLQEKFAAFVQQNDKSKYKASQVMGLKIKARR
jgi:type I restriction enzyme, S subunit